MSAWPTMTLEQLCELHIGKTPARDNPSYWDRDKKERFIWLSIADMARTNSRFVADSKEYISAKGAALFKPVAAGTLLMSFKLTIGRLVYAANTLYTNEAIVALPIKDANVILKEYLYYFLRSVDWNKLTENDMKVKGKTLNKKKLKQLEILVPPLPVQKAIVAKLDAAFASIDTAIAAAEKNAENAKQLFQSYLSEVFEHGGEGWVERTLDEVCVVERGSSPRPIQRYFTTAEDGVNWIKIGDTEEGGKYVYSTNQKITREGALKSREVNSGDFILTNSMSYGRPYIMRTDGYIHDGWFVLRLNENIDAEYFFYLLSSPFVQKQFGQLAAGAVVKNISGDLVKRTKLPLPSLTLQKELAERFIQLEDECVKLRVLFERKIQLEQSLKQSLLQQAFSGQLAAA